MTESPRQIILFDLDNTLADATHRQHLVNPPRYPHGEGEQTHPKKDYPAFFKACVNDAPIAHTCEILARLKEFYEIWIVSGRSDEVRDETILWLHKHGVHYDRIFMRKAGDYTPDDELKQHWLDAEIPKERVLLVFDDRQRVVEMWRRNGLPCFQVQPGDF